ncbi:hypothetical protein LJC54_02680 [Parabacteroides sp. OttesenSCG-928-J18]|nr:hypothetical protein [Parabacteroides sp. OttesenSCG-928-J18]
MIKNLGVIILLIGVAILAIPAITNSMSNTFLVVGLIVIIIGYLGHIFLNKKEG